MNAQESALSSVASFLDAAGLGYMVIGGMANAIWGVPRATLDVDVTIWAEDMGMEAAVEALCGRFACRVSEPVAFARRTRVLPLTTGEGTPVDVIFGLLPFELEAIGRGLTREIGGQLVRFCTAEDLVLMKIISGRTRDLDDAKGVLGNGMLKLDHGYMFPRVQELAALMEDPGILERYHSWKRKS